MNSKTSIFCKSIFKSDMKRFWWLSLAASVFLSIFVCGSLYITCSNIMLGHYPVYYAKDVFTYDAIYSTMYSMIIFAMVMALMLFSYMHNVRSVSFYHSLPVTRGSIYITKLISGAVLVMVPIVLCGIVLGAMSFSPTCRSVFSLGDVLCAIYAVILYAIIVFSLTSFVNMMTGYTVGAILFTLGFMLLPMFLISSFEAIAAKEIYGYVGRDLYTLLSDFIYISMQDVIHFPYVLIYIGASGLFLAGGYVLYRKRSLESYGEIIAFSWLKPVFIVIIGVLSSILSYLYFSTMNKTNIFFALPLGLLGTVIAWMVSRKSLSLRGVIKPVVIYLVSGGIVCCAISYTANRVEKYLPTLDEISSITVNGSRDTITDKDTIETFLNYNREMIDTKDTYREYMDVFDIQYMLNDGRTVTRSYWLDSKTDQDIIDYIYKTVRISDDAAYTEEEASEIYED